MNVAPAVHNSSPFIRLCMRSKCRNCTLHGFKTVGAGNTQRTSGRGAGAGSTAAREGLGSARGEDGSTAEAGSAGVGEAARPPGVAGSTPGAAPPAANCTTVGKLPVAPAWVITFLRCSSQFWVKLCGSTERACARFLRPTVFQHAAMLCAAARCKHSIPGANRLQKLACFCQPTGSATTLKTVTAHQTSHARAHTQIRLHPPGHQRLASAGDAQVQGWRWQHAGLPGAAKGAGHGLPGGVGLQRGRWRWRERAQQAADSSANCGEVQMSKAEPSHIASQATLPRYPARGPIQFRSPFSPADCP